MMIRSTPLCLLSLCLWAAGAVPGSAAAAAPTAGGASYDVLISGASVYDGSGGEPFVGDVAIAADRIVYVGRTAPGSARERVDAHGKAVAPGFINMLAHPEESLLRRWPRAERPAPGRDARGAGRGFDGAAQSPRMKRARACSGRATSTMRSTGPRSASTSTSSSDAALRRTSPPTWARAPCAPTCSASATCSRPPRSSSRCAPWCARRWSKVRSASRPRSSTAPTSMPRRRS